MATTEHECTKQEQLDRIERLISKTYDAIHGNGSPGLKTMVHSAVAQTRYQWVVIVLILSGLLGLAIGKL